MSKGPGYLLLAGGLGVHGERGQHACIRGHLALVSQAYDDDPHSAERESLEEQGEKFNQVHIATLSEWKVTITARSVPPKH